MKKFSPNDLLLYVLNELDDQQRQELEQLLPHEPNLKIQIDELMLALQDINEFELNPNPKSLDVILNRLHEVDHVQIL